jgi:lipooligosaccharide transport system ATP-binding protein
MKMIAAVSTRSSGNLEVLGMDPNTDGPAIRSQLGVVPQEDNLDQELRVRENLITYGRFFGMSHAAVAKRADELLEFAQLADRAKSKVEPLSGGMKRRLTIARSLMNDPQMLLLDEPTTGLDPQARHILWDRLFRLKEQGTTLVLTTHYMDEAEQLSDRIIVVDKGAIMAEGSPAQLIRQYSSKEVLEVRYGSDKNMTVAKSIADIGERQEILPDRILIYSDNGERDLAVITKRGHHPTTSLVRRSSLEDVFLRLTGRTLVE